MSVRAVTFVEIWVQKTLPENVCLSQAEARQAAIHLLLDAAAIGISPHEIEEEYSELADFIATPDLKVCAANRQRPSSAQRPGREQAPTDEPGPFS